jgi:methylmalonyl-CoA mutase N-terminal domain/subunit
MGGALTAIERGYMQNEIQNAAYEAQKAIERGEQIVVGVNQYQVQEQVTLERLQVDPAIEAAARKRLEQLRARRDAAKAAELMSQLEAAARGDQNMMPLFVECVENDVTLGEICGVLRSVWGEYEARAF